MGVKWIRVGWSEVTHQRVLCLRPYTNKGSWCWHHYHYIKLLCVLIHWLLVSSQRCTTQNKQTIMICIGRTITRLLEETSSRDRQRPRNIWQRAQRMWAVSGHTGSTAWLDVTDRQRSRKERETQGCFQQKMCLLSLMGAEKKTDERDRGGERDKKCLEKCGRRKQTRRWKGVSLFHSYKPSVSSFIPLIPVIKTQINPSALFCWTLS